MQHALDEIERMGRSVGFELSYGALSDEEIEQSELLKKGGTMVNGAIIDVLSPAKSLDNQRRDPEMYQAKKCNE